MIQLRVGIHGKLPDRGDFISLDAQRADVELIEHTFGTFSEGGGRLADSAPAYALLRRRDGWLLSCWLPSSDEVGRAYPLVALARLPSNAIGADPAAAPALFMPVFDRMFAACSGCTSNELRGRLDELSADIDPQRVAAFGHRLLGSESSATLLREAWGAQWNRRSAEVFAELLDRQAQGHPLLCIEGAVSTSHVAFWFTAACLTRPAGEMPQLCVIKPEPARPRLICAWDRPGPELLAACLWEGAWAANYRPARIPGADGRPVPGWLHNALRESGPTLRDLLYALAHPEQV